MVQLQVTPHDTKPVAPGSPLTGQSAAFAKIGIKIIDNRQNKIIGKNIFFIKYTILLEIKNFKLKISFVPSPGLEPGMSASKAEMISNFNTRAIGSLIFEIISNLLKKINF